MPDAGAAHPTIALLQTSSLARAVQAELERMILGGELSPGERLTETALAARLGVSRGPLREAFRMLDEGGLVRTEKNRGVFVRDLGLAEAIELFDLRAAIDGLVGRRLAETITPAALRELRAKVDALEHAAKSKDAEAYRLLSLAFDARLAELTGNARLAATHRKLVNELSLFRRRDRTDGAILPAAAGEHRQIVKAIASADAEAAANAMFDRAIRGKERALGNGPRVARRLAATRRTAKAKHLEPRRQP